ncbi:MAG: aminotransferase class I/II-fold pyridoxal phosphate-dependent enzyme, partial [Geminicoccaceae bacterium]
MRLAAAMGRLGTESAFEVLARATALKAQGRDIINLGIGQPDFPTPPHIVEAAVKALRDGHHGYTPANGILPLREAVVRDMAARRGVEVDPASVVIVPGGKVTMAFAMLMFGEPGAQIMYPDPGFPIYRSMIEFTGAEAVPMALHESKGFAFSADEVLGQITDRTRLIIVNSPANPTGGVVPKAELDKFVKGLADFPEVAVMSDEIYSRMCYDGVPHASLTTYPEIADRLILLDGWSKTYAMTGWRLGWIVAPQHLVEPMAVLAECNNTGATVFAQAGGLAALEEGEDFVRSFVARTMINRDLVMELIGSHPKVTLPEPEGAFYAFPRIEGLTDSLAFAREVLQRCKVGIAAGYTFGAGNEGHVRLCFAIRTERLR